jgi:recombination protein RecR
MKRYKIEAFDNLVSAFQELPSIGKKSAIRMAYNIVMEDSFSGMKLAHAIEEAVNNIQRCKRCHNMSEDEFRDNATLCIV